MWYVCVCVSVYCAYKAFSPISKLENRNILFTSMYGLENYISCIVKILLWLLSSCPIYPTQFYEDLIFKRM